MGEGQEVPDHREHGPGHVEGGGEAEDDPGPGELYGRAEEILQEAVLLLGSLGLAHCVHSPVLSEEEAWYSFENNHLQINLKRNRKQRTLLMLDYERYPSLSNQYV